LLQTQNNTLQRI